MILIGILIRKKLKIKNKEWFLEDISIKLGKTLNPNEIGFLRNNIFFNFRIKKIKIWFFLILVNKTIFFDPNNLLRLKFRLYLKLIVIRLVTTFPFFSKIKIFPKAFKMYMTWFRAINFILWESRIFDVFFFF